LVRVRLRGDTVYRREEATAQRLGMGRAVALAAERATGDKSMARNVEWKARAREPERQRALAEQLAGAPPELLEQIDTFFRAAHGRLKLRQFATDRGELIHYHRADQTGPKESTYALVSTDAPDAVRNLLAQSLGVLGELRKRRWLYRLGPTRIHLDEVKNLGTFLEVEVILRSDQPVHEGEQIAEEVRRQLDVRDEELIAVAYLDLLLARPTHEDYP
jgi:predicted adenylyl cyclase CyaB